MKGGAKMAKYAKLIDEKDNVVTVVADCNAGESIGAASQDIKMGDWVHTQNVKDDYKVLDKEGNPLPGQEG
jgi:hypothetical protein